MINEIVLNNYIQHRTGELRITSSDKNLKYKNSTLTSQNKKAEFMTSIDIKGNVTKVNLNSFFLQRWKSLNWQGEKREDGVIAASS